MTPHAPVFNADRPAVEGRMAAGILLMADIEDRPHALLGKRRQDGCWSDLGGLSNAKDRTASRTAWRESIEELGAFQYLDYLSILNAPFIDYQGQEVLYRMHLLKVDPFSTAALNQHIDSQQAYKREHKENILIFSGFPLKSYSPLLPCMSQ